MTTQEAARKALEALQNASALDHSFSSQKKYYEAIDALRTALAQHGQEPVAWIEIYKHSGGEQNWERRLRWKEPNVKLPAIHGKEPLYIAAPAPQPAISDEWLANCPQEVRDFANKLKAAPQPAQDFQEWWNSLPCEPSYQEAFAAGQRVAWSSALQSAQPVAPKGCISNCDTCTYHHQSPAQAGHCYMFYEEPQGVCGQWKDAARPVAAVPLPDDEILSIAHRKATRYTHAVAPGQVTYGFTVAHLLDFVRAIEAAHGITEKAREA